MIDQRDSGRKKVRVLSELEPSLRWSVVDIPTVEEVSPFTSPGSDITRPPFSTRETRTMQQQGILAVHFFNSIWSDLGSDFLIVRHLELDFTLYRLYTRFVFQDGAQVDPRGERRLVLRQDYLLYI